MKIVFLSHYFPPESNAPANRVSSLARHWVAQGHEVTVVTCQPNHPVGKLYDGFENKLYAWDEWEGVKILRVWTLIRERHTTITQTLNYLVYMLLSGVANATLRGADVVIATSPQFFCGFGGTMLSKYLGRKMVVEIRDLWPETFNAVGVVHNQRILDALEQLELLMYRTAGRIVTVTWAFRENMVARGIPREKIEVIPNGIDTDVFSKDVVTPVSRAELGIPEGACLVSYVGTIGRAQKLESLLGVFAALRERKDIAFLIMGGGAGMPALQEAAKSQQLDNLWLFGHQPADRARGVLAASDISLIHLKKSDVFKKVIPSKIFESMGLEKPIVLGVEGQAAEIVEAGAAGLTVEPENVEAHVEAITALVDDPEGARAMGLRGRAHVVEHFDRETLAQKYLDYLVDYVRYG